MCPSDAQRDEIAALRGATEPEDEVVTIQGDREIEVRVFRHDVPGHGLNEPGDAGPRVCGAQDRDDRGGHDHVADGTEFYDEDVLRLHVSSEPSWPSRILRPRL